MSSFYGTVPANQTAKWHPEPTFRGTWSILSSCLITISLCVWTAVHLNVPEHGQKDYFGGWVTMQQLRKAKWLLIGLFAPEVVRICEMKQGLKGVADEIVDCMASL
jgi:hypothetical protein